MLEGGMFNHTTEVLPIEALLPDLLETLGSGTRCILEAAPGAGKTTRVPLALLRAAWLDGKGILMLEPRRMAARNAAHRILGRPQTLMANCILMGRPMPGPAEV